MFSKHFDKAIYLVLICHNYMAKFVCRDYGYDCNFVAEGSDEEVTVAFGKHSEEEHGIEYSKETLTKFMLDNNY